ncbi:hypothetical protein AU05_08250 [Ectopseudomonas composti]|uniref:Uncharacterized protein n=1 Tax=Ectopseudomonas composti TaxID=658457 RepID=A0ABN0SES9_9GAMM|nr:hypothetical protein [Pseudomonas composti]EZH82276.1 hypothetical protein AU05_08250 [Pseudomonas composti]
MQQKRALELIEKFQESFNQYHKLFLENYPLFSTKDYDFGSRELNTLGIKCQAYMTMLGKTAKARMNYIGFRQLFAFDNEVDWYSWKTWINKNRVDHTQYLSISMRIDTELKRMREFLKEDMWEVYCSLEENEFSVSYLRYEDFQPVDFKQNENLDNPGNPGSSTNIQVILNNHPEKVEKQMFSNIERIEKNTSILANIATFIARISGVKI